jgi:hypothetical protein
MEGTTNVDFSDNEPLRVTVVFLNSGKTPARNVQTSAMYKTSNVPLSGPSARDVRKLIFQPAQSIAPQGRYNQNLGRSVAPEASSASQEQGARELASEHKLIKSKQLLLYYYGIIKYDDIFGHPHQTQWCIYLANPETKDIGMCDAFNDLN